MAGYSWYMGAAASIGSRSVGGDVSGGALASVPIWACRSRVRNSASMFSLVASRTAYFCREGDLADAAPGARMAWHGRGEGGAVVVLHGPESVLIMPLQN